MGVSFIPSYPHEFSTTVGCFEAVETFTQELENQPFPSPATPFRRNLA